MKKVIGLSTFIVIMLVSVVGITYSYEYNENESLTFELIGDYELELELGEEYYEYGILVKRNGVDISSSVNIDSSSVDMDKVGEYKVKYEVFVDGNIEYIYRKVNVRENIKPEIKLLGEEIMYIDLNSNYIEPGYIVSDNYDTDLDNKVIINSNLVVGEIGEYKIEYSVVDSSGNESTTIRKVIVQ